MTARTLTHLDAVTANTTGATVRNLTGQPKQLVQAIVSGSPDAVVNIDGSLDGSNWHILATITDAEDIVEVFNTPFMRVRLTNYVSGAWTVLSVPTS